MFQRSTNIFRLRNATALLPFRVFPTPFPKEIFVTLSKIKVIALQLASIISNAVYISNDEARWTEEFKKKAGNKWMRLLKTGMVGALQGSLCSAIDYSRLKRVPYNIDF